MDGLDGGGRVTRVLRWPQRALRRGWERAVLAGAPVPVLLLDVDGSIRFCTASAARALSGAREDLVGTPLQDLVAPEDRPTLEGWLAELAGSGADRSVHHEVALAGTPPRSVELNGTNLSADPRVRAIAVLVVDTTVQRAREMELRHLALYDVLTGLPNRALLHERLTDATRSRGGTALIVLDLDRFKDVNDEHGHAAGDDLLCAVARRFASALPRGATPARMGGDEFAVVLPKMGAEAATDVAERLIRLLDDPLETPFGALDVTACAGVAAVTGRGSASDLMREADTAMYQAKGQGHGQVAVYRPGPVDASPSREIDLVDRLRAEKEELERLVGIDELTGIGNLRRYRQRLAALDRRARDTQEPYSLLFCDIDSFGRFNKVHGQAAGDRALRAVATAIVEELRSGDEVHRRGGEELVVLLPDTDGAEAVVVAERMRAAVSSATIARGDGSGQLVVTISIGVGTFDPTSSATADQVEATADAAMRRAKADGKDCVAY